MSKTNEDPERQKGKPPHKAGESKPHRKERVDDAWLARFKRQGWVLICLFSFFGVSLAAFLTMFFLQGFRTAGFSLDSKLLSWFGKATVGEIATLIVIAFREVFRKR
jgi:multisubunit Na+/H+ antiporter MnhB subunit